MLTAFDLCLGARGVLLTLAGTAIDFVVDRLTGLVLLQRSWSFLRSEIAAVPIDLFLISGKKFRGHRNIIASSASVPNRRAYCRARLCSSTA